jgi:glycosyltransferase involved in cell wall biosynthesis
MDLSVIIPAYNEENFIEQCCFELQRGLRDAGLNYEILVVDNGSSDGTGEILSKIEYIKTIAINRSSISYARNYGAQRSSGRILAFVDADVVVGRKWIESIKRLFDEKSKPMVTGFQYLVRPEGTWIERHWFSSIDSSHINGGNLIVSRSAFDQLQGFNERLKTGEDVDFCDRARQLDFIDYSPEKGFEAIHLGYPRTISHFMRREMWHGEGDFFNVKFFLRSKIAMIAVLYAVFQVLFFALLFLGLPLLAFFVVLILIMINYLITFLRFNDLSPKSYLVNAILNYLYFMARFGSLFKALANRSRIY